jgi:hypothetical protein
MESKPACWFANFRVIPLIWWDMLVATRDKNVHQFINLATIAGRNNYKADELNLLFDIIPMLAKDSSTDVQLILAKGKRYANTPAWIYGIWSNFFVLSIRTKQLGKEMLEGLHEAQFNRPDSANVMPEVENFFQLSPHPNPEVKVLGRIDWLPRVACTISEHNGQLEAPTKTCLAKATEFLGRNVLKNLMLIMQWFTQAATSVTTNTHQKVAHISTSLQIGRDLLDVS